MPYKAYLLQEGRPSRIDRAFLYFDLYFALPFQIGSAFIANHIVTVIIL